METIDYSSQRPSVARRWIVRGVVVVAAGVSLYLLGLVVPLHRTDQAFMCRLCGSTERRSIWRSCGVAFWRRTKPLHVDHAATYNRLIAEPHQHAWFSYAVTRVHGNMWGYGGIGEGGPNEPALAVIEALRAMETDYANLPLERRRTMYADMQKCNTRDEVLRYVAEHPARHEQTR